MFYGAAAHAAVTAVLNSATSAKSGLMYSSHNTDNSVKKSFEAARKQATMYLIYNFVLEICSVFCILYVSDNNGAAVTVTESRLSSPDMGFPKGSREYHHQCLGLRN